MLLTLDRIKQAIEDAHKKQPGRILTTSEIYEAITQAQYSEDTREANMEILKKLAILKKLDTKGLTEKIQQYEDALEKAMITQAGFKNSNHGFLGIGDCLEVKRILAELIVQAPEANEAGKKLTVADREAWLTKQRKENKELLDTITKQRQVAFLLDDHQIKVEMAKKRLEGVKAALAVRIAQINFLASG